MRARLNTFKSKNGDCIFFRLNNGETDFNIMIDCAMYTDEIRGFVENELKKHINLLIVTHIDFDHVDGLCTMLRETQNLKIDKIFYNCYQLVTGETIAAMTDVVLRDIEYLKSNLPKAVINTTTKISMEHASVLASLIMSNPNWNNAWEKSFYIHNDIAPYSLGECFGRLVFLSPTLANIQVLDKKFGREYMRLTTHRASDTPFEGRETLYELVTRLVLMKKREGEYIKKHKVAAVVDKYTEDKWNQAYAFIPTCISEENMASIAFVWEYGENRVLFMGDAEPELVKTSIEKNYKQVLNFKAIKVSHHGSKHSTSVGLMNVADSTDYFITGGTPSDKPSLEAITKIVDRKDDKMRTIHINNERNNLMQDLMTDKLKMIRDKFNFQILTTNELEFEY